MTRYQNQSRMLVAVDCIIFGFDGSEMKLLLIHRGFEPFLGKWSLMGGFVSPNQSADEAASKILAQLTGLTGVYLEQLHTYTDPVRDSQERTISITYFALIDIQQYEQQINDEYMPQWFSLNKIPKLIFDHNDMVQQAIQKLQTKAALNPLLFELLPEKFTLPQLQNLYESVYGTAFDKRNFSRKVLSTNLVIKQKDKDKTGSKKGAFFYKLNKKKYKSEFQYFSKLIPAPQV